MLGDSLTESHAWTPSRTTAPALETRLSAFTQATMIVDARGNSDPAKRENESATTIDTGPPPVNRAAKPKVPLKPLTLSTKPTGLVAPEFSHTELTDHSNSPFSTPPSSRASSPDRAKTQVAQRPRNDSDASWVERLRSDSTTSSIPRDRGNSDVSFMDRARAGSNASFVEPSTLLESLLETPPIHHQTSADPDQQVTGTPRRAPARYRPVHVENLDTVGEAPEERPRLPVRPELQIRPGRHSPSTGRTSPTKPRSGRTSPSKERQGPDQELNGNLRKATTMAEHTAMHRIPASRAPQKSALAQGFGQKQTLRVAPGTPAPRRSMDKRPDRARLEAALHTTADVQSQDNLVDTPLTEAVIAQAINASEFPDASQASRRPPKYIPRPHHVPTDYDTRLMAVCGEYVCTSGYITKAWNLRTGAQLLSLTHHEGSRVTSIVFKPTSSLEDEGKRVWLGTSAGEIHEVDIPSQSLIKTKIGAHNRREVSRMFRHASELWTLDDGGDFNVWKPDHKGMPSLDSQYVNFRVPKGHTFSLACGKHIWIAYGKELRIYYPSSQSDSDFQVLRAPLTQPGTGDITAGTTLSSKPDLVYFGHLDGKVSIYDRHDFSCKAVVNVSLYKISALAGVGEYLWAGYNTGMMYVYDPATTPWKVKKDWQAHDKQICSIVADSSALWKMDRLQVVSLGTDNMLRLWDGLLEEDWLDSQMLLHDSTYCTFRELTAAVLTWNAGASTPHDLQGSMDDSNFLYEYLNDGKPADILVFGFQELVDLEDKKVTAKSFFKSKKKDPGEPEHMSYQYRTWRDHLTKCIDEFMGPKNAYTLLHTASMVGLFTCVFVRSSERSRIKHVHTGEVKRGMGGLHGNKGALIMRMVLDDSSMCFVNCHLAAGQTQTINRNNDIAAILEADCLPAHPLGANSRAQHSDVFAGGGNGSMILDHEICILNGDLNYRIDTMGRDTVVKHVASDNLARLLDRDQLLLSRKKNPGFRLRIFTESPITFAPTYKYNVRSDTYDTSEKRRAPAWCDRILYRGIGKVKMEDDQYRRWEVRVSDHRPVSARLRVRVKTVDTDRRKQAWETCVRQFDTVRVRVAKGVQ